MTQRILGKSPLGAWLRVNAWLWARLPASVAGLRPVRAYGAAVHALARRRAPRRPSHGTFFFRNRQELALLHRLCDRRPAGEPVRICVLACSVGAEVYSIRWTLRTARPDVKVVLHAVDMSSEAVRFAERGVYRRAPDALQGPSIFERMTDEEMRTMFVREGDGFRIVPALRDVSWHVADAADPEILDLLGPQDIVVANRFLCHMPPDEAARCLRSLARLVAPGGYLFVSGVDLDVRTTIARALGWTPQQELLEEIHDGDRSLRDHWPWDYTGLEPLDKRRSDWRLRYASVFQLGRRS